MISLYRKFPAVMGTLCLVIAGIFLYFSMKQYRASKDLPAQPEKMALVEIRHRMEGNPVDIWAEVVDGTVDCRSIEQWQATTNYFFVDKYSTFLLVDSDNAVVLRGTVDGWPDCSAVKSQLPLTGIVSLETASNATEVWEKNYNNIRLYPQAYVLSFCSGCTPAKQMQTVWIGIGLAVVFSGLFVLGVYMEFDRHWKASEKSAKEPPQSV